MRTRSTLVLTLGIALSGQVWGCTDDDEPLLDMGTRDGATADAKRADLRPEGGLDRGLDSGDASAAVDGPPLTLVANEYPCKSSEGKIYPSKSKAEQGFLIAAKLTPPQYPFTVTAVRYLLEASDKCNNTMEHRVEVSSGTGNLPENNPKVLETINVAAASSAPKQRMVQQKLAKPIQLSSGEHLFVAVEMPEDSAGKLGCLTVCMGNGIKDHTFWSNATKAPYKWTALNGISINVVIMALGYQG